MREQNGDAAAEAHGRRAGFTPLWRQIESALREAIAAGTFKPGTQIPPDRQLAEHFGASRLTVRKALAPLEQEGLIRIEQGNGTFVSHKVRYALGRRVRFNQSLRALNVKPRRQLTKAEEVAASVAIAARLGIGAGETVAHLNLVSFADERPIAVSSRYFPLPRFRAIASAYRQHESITGALRALGVADYRRQTTEISARLPNALEARLLEQPKSRPVLGYKAVDVDLDERPIALNISCASADRVVFVIDEPTWEA